MDFVRGGKKAWGVSGSCRHLAPAKQSLALGSSQILPAARRTSGEKWGCLEDENGRVSASLP